MWGLSHRVLNNLGPQKQVQLLKNRLYNEVDTTEQSFIKILTGVPMKKYSFGVQVTDFLLKPTISVQHPTTFGY